ncbi:hypothetical protein [Virgibacillus dokdonensis]|uniref:hypothetical protein n=1 Tax=Virgibacillus dokdonensis TaxID=302167 RepID=UPI00098B9CF7|nr:hypothetical protein [Virgibacillus dokdonensis]
MLENKIKFKKANEKGSNSFGTLLNILDFKESETDKIQKTLSGEFAEEISFLSIRKQKMIPYFSVVHKIGSLPEIQVLQEFTRIENLDRSELAKTKDLIPVMKYKNNKRLPGIRNDGEVIFF